MKNIFRTVPVLKLISCNHLGFPTLPSQFGEMFGEICATWIELQRNLQKTKSAELAENLKCSGLSGAKVGIPNGEA